MYSKWHRVHYLSFDINTSTHSLFPDSRVLTDSYIDVCHLSFNWVHKNKIKSGITLLKVNVKTLPTVPACVLYLEGDTALKSHAL